MLNAGRSTTKTKYFVTAAVVAAAGAFAILMAVRPANAEQFATLRVLSGTVSVSVQGADVVAATDGMSVKAGDVVETGNPGRAMIRYFDGSETRLDADTRYEIRDLHTLPNKAQSKVIRGKQTRGATFNRIVKLTDSQSRVETEAPTSTASVRGTAYSGTANEDGTFTWRVFEGRVKITDASGRTVIVEAGQGVVIDEDGNIVEVYDLSDEELQTEWVVFNDCTLDGIRCPEVLGEKETGGPGTPTNEPAPNNQPNNQNNNEPNGNAPGNAAAPSATPTATPAATPAATPTATPTATPSGSPSPTPTPTPDPVLTSIVASWSPQNPAAGQSIVFSVLGFDQNGDSMGNVTGGTTFSITPDGTCAANVCRATVAGVHRVTATNGTATDTALFNVAAGPAAALAIAPSNATISPGESQAYTAVASDEFGNPLGNVTGTTLFSIAPDGSCAAAVCTASIVGPHTVTGAMGSLLDTASLNVIGGSLASISLSPSASAIAAGDTQTYLAEGFDAAGNSLGDVTGLTIFTIEPAAEIAAADEACDENVCGGTAAGPYVVTGIAEELSDTATLTIEPGAAQSLELSPSDATVDAGVPQSFEVEAFDEFDNSLGDVTGETGFDIEPAGVFAAELPDAICEANICTAYGAGDWLVTATFGDLTGSALLTIHAGPLAAVEIAPGDATITAGGTQTYTTDGFDEYGNLLGDVTADTTFTIEPAEIFAETADAYACAANVCGATAAGFYVVTGTSGEAFDSAFLTVESAEVASIQISPAEATITAGDSQGYTAEGFDALGNSLGDVTDQTGFGIDGAGWCEGTTCGSNYAGTYTVTGFYGGGDEITATASLTVDPTGIASLDLNPPSATKQAGKAQNYTAFANDEFGNRIGNVTVDTTFSITNGTCDANECKSSTVGEQTVTGSYLGVTGTATLNVTPAGGAGAESAPSGAASTPDIESTGSTGPAAAPTAPSSTSVGSVPAIPDSPAAIMPEPQTVAPPPAPAESTEPASQPRDETPSLPSLPPVVLPGADDGLVPMLPAGGLPANPFSGHDVNLVAVVPGLTLPQSKTRSARDDDSTED